MSRGLGALVVLVVLAWPSGALALGDPSDPGQTTAGSFGDYRYVRYVPASLPAHGRVPLVVMVHGAQTTAEQELHVTRFNKVAEREGFVVLYPDVDTIGRSAPGPINQSWRFYDVSTYFRGNGDSAAIAEMTKDQMGRLPIDPERVYAVGVSAGGLMTTILAAAYPEIYAATGNVESAGYADATCFTTGTGTPAAVNAQLAFAQMGGRARIVPTMVITSDADLAFPKACGEKALEQSLRVDNLALSGSQDTPLALTPATVTREQEPGGLAYDVSTYTDPQGCRVGEKWLIHGMPHAWPGGPATDPAYAGYADRRAPSGAEGVWAFLRRYAKSATALPCAEAPAPTGPAVAPVTRCPSRLVTVPLPAGARVRRATVDGRRVRVRRTSTAVRLRLPATTRKRAKVVVTATSSSGRTVIRRRAFRRC